YARDAGAGAGRVLDGVSRALPRRRLRAHRTTRQLTTLASNRARSGLHQLLVPRDPRPVPGQRSFRSAIHGADAGSESPVASVGTRSFEPAAILIRSTVGVPAP